MARHRLNRARVAIAREFRHAGGGHHAVAPMMWDRVWSLVLWAIGR